VGGASGSERIRSIQPCRLVSGVPIWWAASRAIATQSRSRCAFMALRYANTATPTITAIVRAWSSTSAVSWNRAGGTP
jgi:hypothetical protein